MWLPMRSFNFDSMIRPACSPPPEWPAEAASGQGQGISHFIRLSVWPSPRTSRGAVSPPTDLIRNWDSLHSRRFRPCPRLHGQNSTAEVKVHPSGRFVWVSNRGHDSLAGFAIHPEGQLSLIGQTSTEKTPRSFDVDPSGRFVLGAGEGSGKLAVFTVDLESGTLTRRHTYDVGTSLSWVRVAHLNSN